MTKSRYYTLIIILGALTALGPFSIDMYLPGFPDIAKSFGVSTARVTLSLSSFFLGISIGQVLYGPLIDRYGRKIPLYAGLIVYIIASAGCYFASSIEMLTGFRFVQAVGSCAAGVVSMAMVRDLFPLESNAKIFSLLLLVLGASPMVAPSVGAIITSSFGWQAIFVILSLMTFVILLTVYFFLPESRTPDKSFSLKPKPILKGFWDVLSHPRFATFAFGGGIAFSGLFAYVSDSPTIFIEGYGVSNRTYGWLFAILAIGFVCASQLNRLLSNYFRPEQIITGAIACMVICSSLLLYGLNQGWFGIVGTAVIIFIFLSCIGILNPIAAALSMAPFEKNAGSAASLYGLIQWGIAGLSSIAVSMFKSKTPVPLALTMASTALLSLVIIYLGQKAIKKQPPVVNSNPLQIIH